MLTLTVGDIVCEPFKYSEGCEIEIPLKNSAAEIKVEFQGNPEQKKGACIKQTFNFEPGQDYQCRLGGRITNFTGLGLQLCSDSEDIEDKPTCRNNLPIALLSFCFPIYGIINAIRSNYNRKAALWGALIGFIVATSFSAMPEEGEYIGFGIGRMTLFEYEPFSIIDIVINLLIGGVSTLRGFVYLLFN